MTQATLPIDSQAVVESAKNRQEPEWMTSLRSKALDLATTLQLPKLEKTRIDRWNLSSFGAYKSTAPLAGVDDLPEQAKALLNPHNVLIQRNSGRVFASLTPELARQGVIFTDLETAVREHGSLVQKYFMQAVDIGENLLTALHTAAWSGGIFLYVPKNVAVSVPLQALFLTDDAAASFSPHVLIVVEANASVTYVDNYMSAGGGEALVHNGVVEVFAASGASVQYASVHHLGKNVTDLTYRRAVLDNDARIQWVVGELNAGNTMSDTTTVLKGNGASADVKVICIGTEEQKLNLTTRNIHVGRSTESDMITRAVMRDESTAIINGITKIEKGATKANGQQTEKVLMLSPKARGDANPILLIDEDDVMAAHAASVGQVNAEQVFYMMSRGISREEATRLIVYGFLAPVVSKIPIDRLEEQLQRLVERKLGQ